MCSLFYIQQSFSWFHTNIKEEKKTQDGNAFASVCCSIMIVYVCACVWIVWCAYTIVLLFCITYTVHEWKHETLSMTSFLKSPFYFLNDTFPRRKCFASLYVMLGGVGRFSLKPSLRHLGFFFSTEQLSGWNGIKKENCHDVNFDKSVICLLDTGRRTGVIPRATRLAPCCGQKMLSKVGVFIFLFFMYFESFCTAVGLFRLDKTTAVATLDGQHRIHLSRRHSRRRRRTC